MFRLMRTAGASVSLCRFQSQPVLKGPSERPPLAQGWNETDLEQKKQICQLCYPEMLKTVITM